MRKPVVLVFVTVIQLCGLYCILVGVIGEKKIVAKEITPIPQKVHNNSHAGYYAANVDKIVLFIIDALRVDFLFRDSLPFLSRKLDEEYGCVYVTQVKAPTVTLPRIKTIVSGDISTYWDFIHNFKSSAMNQDNFIWQAYERSKNLIFYGDDTWLKLFPTQFTRSEGVSSFYVSDFIEVDNNVTRNVRNELSSGKYWDLMVLHYLGLDHIGHVHGPNSLMIPGKLREMDKIIEEIYTHLKNQKGNSMIMICGDHGMANIGGHGGNTYPEVTTPLVFLSTETMKRCSNSNWRDEPIQLVDQTDVASTMSALWGLPFPAQSVGVVIPGVLGHTPLKDQLFTLHYNAIHLKKLLSKLSDRQDRTDLFRKFDDVTKAHLSFLEKDVAGEEPRLFNQYKNLLSVFSAACTAAVGEQNTLQMICGIFVVFQAFIMSHLTWVDKDWSHDVICSSIMILTSVLTLIFRLDWSLPLIVVNFSILYLKFDWMRFNIPRTESTVNRILVGIHYATPLIYFSSSLVEEEHSIRYYLWSTAVLLFIIFVPFNPDGVLLGEVCVLVFAALTTHRIAIAWNQTGQKWTYLADIVDHLNSGYLLSPFVTLVSLAVLYSLRNPHTGRTFLPSLIFIIILKMDAGIVQIVTFGHVKSLAKLGYIVPVFEGLSEFREGFDIRAVLVNVWTLFAILLQRNYNIPLVLLTLGQIKVVSLLCDKLVNLPTRTVIFLWFSYAVFFYQGNSNSIASIDVNSGYMGLEEYNEVLVGLLIFANTFSVPILIFTGYLDGARFNRKGEKYKSEVVTETLFENMARTNGLNAAVYSLVLLTFRHHLFIWSVFTPKLLYLIAFTVLNLVIFSIYALATMQILPKHPVLEL